LVRVKICGNREVQEVGYAARHGADAVGLIIGARHHTEDDLDCDTARTLWQATPPFVTPVIVTHLLSAKEIVARHRRVQAPVIQLHDEIPPQEIEFLRDELPQVSLIKAVHVVDESAVDMNLALVLDFPVNGASRGPYHNPWVGSSSLPPATLNALPHHGARLRPEY
jgi:phosphoribosylanthranilate isomerase